MGRRPLVDDTDTQDRAPINVRSVETKVWSDFKRLAAYHDMTLQDFLKYLVEQEKKNVKLPSRSH